MASMAEFHLSRATVHDLAEIVQLQYQSFKEAHVRELFMGCQSPEDLPRLAHEYARDTTNNPHDIWIKVTDSLTGKIVAASNWMVYLGSASVHPRGSDHAMPWVEEDKAAQAEEILGRMNTTRHANNVEPFIHLHILFTSPHYLRRGIGSMMMHWGCSLADLLFIPAWIEASAEGNFLYKKFGFYDKEQLFHKGEVIGTCMRRDASTGSRSMASARRA